MSYTPTWCPVRAAACVAVLLSGCVHPELVRHDERVLFFPTVGYAAEGGREWVLPIHGWVHEETAAAGGVERFESALGFDGLAEQPSDPQAMADRLAPFVARGREGRRIPVLLGDRVLILSPSGEDGHFRDEIRVPAGAVHQVQLSSGDANPILAYRALCAPGDRRVLAGHIHLLESNGLSIVSDIEDTIRLGHARDTRLSLASTFLEPYRPVPGMAAVYAAWSERCGAAFHYVSASPAQLGRPIAEFLQAGGFPAGSIDLRQTAWIAERPESLASLLNAPADYKLNVLAWLLQTLPQRQFVLIGDSDEHDPEVYAALARMYPRQVRLVLIRILDGVERTSPRYRDAFRDLPEERWMLFEHGRELGRLVPRPPSPRNRPIPDFSGLQVLYAWNVETPNGIAPSAAEGY